MNPWKTQHYVREHDSRFTMCDIYVKRCLMVPVTGTVSPSCPNCILEMLQTYPYVISSEWAGGRPDPETLDFLVACSDLMRGSEL